MEFIRESSIIIEDPFVIRPGTSVTVTARLQESVDYIDVWDSSAGAFNDNIPGFFTISAVISDGIIPPNAISLTYEEDGSTTIDIEQLDLGVISFSINYYETQEANIVSRSALPGNPDDCQYVLLINGDVIPKTLIDLSADFDMDKLDAIINVESGISNRGLVTVHDSLIRVNSAGTTDNDINILRKGPEEVWVSENYTGDYFLIEDGQKKITIDNQEPVPSGLEFFGMENVGDVVFVLTSNGLYGFDRWGDFIDPIDENGEIFHWPDIRGTDITYLPDDSLAIPSGQIINKYFLRHDFVLLDSPNNRIYFREEYPNFEVI